MTRRWWTTTRVQLLTSSLPFTTSEGEIGKLNGSTIYGDPRYEQHIYLQDKLSKLRYLAARFALDRRIIFWRVKKLMRSLRKMRQAFPELTKGLTDKQVTQIFLIAVEAVHAVHFRDYRGDASYTQILDDLFGPPAPDTVSLNSTNCLNTGITGVINTAQGSIRTPGSPRHTEALLKLALTTGVLVSGAWTHSGPNEDVGSSGFSLPQGLSCRATSDNNNSHIDWP